MGVCTRERQIQGEEGRVRWGTQLYNLNSFVHKGFYHPVPRPGNYFQPPLKNLLNPHFELQIKYSPMAAVRQTGEEVLDLGRAGSAHTQALLPPFTGVGCPEHIVD